MLSSGAAFVLFKAIIGFGLPIAVGLHQLHLLKKDKRKGKPGPTGEPRQAPTAEPVPVVANQDKPGEERKAA
jgi:hypothetical protein